jgi:hypothetical protein
MFPGVREHPREGGYYLHFVKVLNTLIPNGFHYVYGGMVASEMGFQGRLSEHDSEAHRRRHPSCCCTLIDTPGTTAKWAIVAVYPKGLHQRALSHLNKSFLIAALRL